MNIIDTDPKGSKRWKTYRADAIYPDGSTMVVYLNERELQKYYLTQELIKLGATPEMLNKISKLNQLAYEEGNDNGFQEGPEM